jgi:hypothetical protein
MAFKIQINNPFFSNNKENNVLRNSANKTEESEIPLRKRGETLPRPASNGMRQVRSGAG